MNIQEKIKYLKKLKYILTVSKKCGQPYSLSEIKDSMDLNILPPMPLYPEAKIKKINFKSKKLVKGANL